MPRWMIAAALLVAACASKDDDDDDDDWDDSGSEYRDTGGVDDGSTTDQTGSEIYDAHCAACHAADGLGGIGPSLAERLPLLDNDALRSVIADGKDGMPAPSLNGAEESVLFNYLRDRFGEEGGA